MQTFWFSSGDARVFAMLDLPPAGEAVGTAVVLCPPLGYQGVCSYRALRALANGLADSGYPTLRFDWPGSGESAGSERDSALVATWAGAVVAAAEEVRERTSAREVALVGVTIGAALAAVAAAEGANVSELVLWAPPRSGTEYLREMRAFQRLAARRYPQTSTPPPPLPAGDEEVNGFLLSAETVRDLEAINVTELSWGSSSVRRVLVAGADPLPPDKELLGALRSHGLEVDVTRLPGVDGMLENPNTSKVPLEAFSSIQSWLSRGEEAGRSRAAIGRGRSLAVDGWTETIVQLDSGGTTIVGTVTHAADDAGGTWLVLPSAGAVRRMGPNRLWTRFARAWAARGVSSLRLDIRGVGDSGGPDASDEHFERLYSPEALGDVAVAIEHVRDHFDARRFAVLGLCSGSVAALHLALERDDVHAGVLINPPFLMWDRNTSDSTHWAHMVSRIGQVRQWRRLATGQVTSKDAKRVLRSGWRALGAQYGRPGATAEQDPAGDFSPDHGNVVVTALTHVAEDGKGLAFIYSQGDVGLTYLERLLGGDVARRLAEEFGASLDIVEGADHTFRPLWTQDRLQTLVEGALERFGVYEVEPPPSRFGLERSRATLDPTV